jgi:hypothetical protein
MTQQIQSTSLRMNCVRYDGITREVDLERETAGTHFRQLDFSEESNEEVNCAFVTNVTKKQCNS